MTYTTLQTHKVSIEDLERTIQDITAKIEKQGDLPHFPVQRQLDLINQMAQFDFGRYLLHHKSINGFWTHYMLTHPWVGRHIGKNNNGNPFTPLEKFILDDAPSTRASQHRFEIFLRENQLAVQNGATLVSVPCGMMGELLYLDFGGITHINLFGIDFNTETLKDAQELAKKQDIEVHVKLLQKDVWQLGIQNEFDLISSDGLNVSERDDARVTELYRQFYIALKPGGKLVTSFLTPPPIDGQACEWNMNHVDMNHFLLQKVIFADILDAKWRCFRSTEQTKKQLESVGFKQIKFIYDQAKIFPTVVAIKKK